MVHATMPARALKVLKEYIAIAGRRKKEQKRYKRMLQSLQTGEKNNVGCGAYVGKRRVITMR